MRLIITFLIILISSAAYCQQETINDYLEYCQDNSISETSQTKTSPKVRKRIVKGGEWGYEQSFTYTEGKITEVDGDKIRYYDSSIVFDGELFSLKDGLISEYNDESARYNFEYKDGKLVSITATYTYNDPSGDRNEFIGEIINYIEFTWENDGIVHQQEWSDYFDGNLKLTRDYYYEYTVNEDYGGICAFLQSNSLLYDDWPEALLIQGYFGKLPKYLVSKATDTLPDGFGMNTFDYRLDSDGYPTYMSRTLKDGRSFPYYFTWETIPPTPAESISLSQDTWSGKAGESFTLTATVLPVDNDDILSWESSDTNIATVDANGTVNAVAVGDATITAICGNVSASCKITVLPTPIESIVLTPESWSGKVGETIILTAKIFPENATDKSLIWSSSDETVATVDANGLVKAINPGKVYIMAKTNDGSDLTAICNVEISSILVESISLTPYNMSCLPGESFTIQAFVMPENATNKAVEWTSSDETIAQVDQEGNVTSIKPGTAIITAKSLDGSDVGAICVVTVKPIMAESISLNMTEWSGNIGETVKLKAVVLPENTTNKTVVWTSEDPSIAFVDNNGNVTAMSVGTTVVTASCDDASASCEITVTAKEISMESITLNAEFISLEIGETYQLIATVYPSDTTYPELEWWVSDKTVASVDQNGLVTMLGEGAATIYVRSVMWNEIEASCRLNVTSSVNGVLKDSMPCSIITIDGKLLKKDVPVSEINNLERGTYIIIQGTKTTKYIK